MNILYDIYHINIFKFEWTNICGFFTEEEKNEGSYTSEKIFKLISNQKSANYEKIRNHFTPTSLTKMKKWDFSKC